MLGSRRVRNLTLNFPQRQQPDHPLRTGVHRLVRSASGAVALGDHVQGALLAQFCVDRRGLWLQVASGMRGVHVNGRAVRRVALLRAGDAVYADGVEVRVRADVAPLPASTPSSHHVEDARVVLRGIGGRHHGRSISLERPCRVGSDAASAIVLESPGAAPAHAVIERHGETVTLRDAGSADGTLVNGQRVRDASLSAGDQLVFDPQSRFVLEVPWACSWQADDGAGAEPALSAVPVAAPRPAGSMQRWPWLLLAALLLAGALAALLLFGAR